MNKEKYVSLLMWFYKHKIVSVILGIIFSPIVIPSLIYWKRVSNKMFFKNLDKCIELGDENTILTNCSNHLRYYVEKNKWKSKISMKWFGKIMIKHQLFLYNYSVKDKEKMKYGMFATLMDVYMKYDIIGGAVINKKGERIWHL